MITATFYGAAGGVTGSKHLLDIHGARILLDCGMFQGLSDVNERNRSFSFPPESIDAVIISHAHLDHCGMLPLLVKRGYSGPIYVTPATKDVARFMLEDMAGIEMQDAAYNARHHIGAPDGRQPLITKEDIAPVIAQMIEVPYSRDSSGWQEIAQGVKLKFYDAGHILGSAISVLEIDHGSNKPYRVAYTGDLGPKGMPLLPDPEVPEEEVQSLILESTYGSKTHEPLENAYERLAETITRVCERKGKIIVPSFSLGRTQILVYLVHKLIDEGRIPRFPIYVDSPLATDITDVYLAHKQNYDRETTEDFGKDHIPLAFRNLTYVRSIDESKQLNTAQGPLMIISAAGMMTAGRVLHHLRHTLSSPQNAIFVTGYQAEGTLGRRILEGAKRVDILGDMMEVRAEVCLFNEFSAHADSDGLHSYIEQTRGVQNVLLVHGEAKQADQLKEEIQGKNPSLNVIRPNEGDTIELQ